MNQNFTDILNSLSDGSKDLTISALTVGGTASFAANVTLGNASNDDVSILGSIAASIPVKTNASFDFGSSTLGMASMYFGSAGGFTTRVLGGATTSWTFTLPVTAGTNRYIMETNGSGVSAWVPIKRSSDGADNLSIAAAVAASALTVSLKAASGSDASSTDPIVVVFRNSTAATGTPVQRTVTGALSVVASSGSTLGHASTVASYIYVYALDNAGTVELAISSSLFDEGSVQTTVAEGGAGGADLNSALYSTTQRTNVPIRLLGRMLSTQATAGTWASTMTEISLPPFDKQRVYAEYSSNNGQTINNNTLTIVNYEDKVIDTHNAVTIGASWQFKSPKAARYQIAAAVGFGALVVSGNIVLELYKAGSVIRRFMKHTISVADECVSGSVAYTLAKDDLLDVRVTQNCTANRALDTTDIVNWVSIIEII